MTKGTLYILSAPSGAGKSSLMYALLNTKKFYNNIKVSISYTTRNMRPNEIHGKDYFFISQKEFKTMISSGDFIEYAEVFGDYYGTSRQYIETFLETDVDIFLDIDWQGAQQIRKQIPMYTRSIFILPPSKEELMYRLQKRGQDSQQIITSRMQKAVSEISHYMEYDYLIINHRLEHALCELKAIISSERLRMNRQKVKHTILISKLLEL